MGPWYSGDGIGETYLDAEYADDSGKPVIKVDDFMQSLNKTAPGPYVCHSLPLEMSRSRLLPPDSSAAGAGPSDSLSVLTTTRLPCLATTCRDLWINGLSLFG